MRMLEETSALTPALSPRRGGIMHSRRHHAFSLIEMIGVLAVIAILAAVLAPAFIRQMDKMAGDNESAVLKSLGDALQASILRSRAIPSHTNWAATVATELGVDVASIMNSPRRQERFFLIDPNLSIKNAGLPYTQSTAGAGAAPLSPRVLILSTIGRALPASIVSGVVGSSTNFNAIWDWNDAGGVVPATSFAWTGWPNSDDLKVQRVNLSPLFVRLLLTTYSSSGSPRYSIDSTSWSTAVVITNNVTIIDRYFIQNSALVLYKHSGEIDSQQILSRDSSFVYDQNVWRGSILGGFFLAGLDVASVVDQYLAAPENPNAANTTATTGATQQSFVVQKMRNYMDAYSAWAAAHAGQPAPWPHDSLWSAANDAQIAMRNAVQDQYLANTHNPPTGGVPCN
jgi:prepilin-type N-terminal cleavage/methylation domain-containing protein